MSIPTGSLSQQFLPCCLLTLIVCVCWFVQRRRQATVPGKIEELDKNRLLVGETLHSPRFDLRDALPCQFLFHDRLSRQIALADGGDEIFAVMSLDLTNFKAIISSLGYEAEEGLLTEISRRLAASLGEFPSVARSGNDSFLLLFTHLQAVENAGKIAVKLLEIFELPFPLNHHEFCLTATIGIAVYPGDGNDPHRLLSQAGTALLHAKELGRNRYAYFTPAMTVRSLARLNLEADLRRALRSRELVIHYQPQIDLVSGAVIGAEALVRWQHPEQGLMLPEHFIAVAEESGMICVIGEMVLQAACHQAQAWRQSGLPLQRITVNLSARQFQQPELALQIERALQQSGLPGSALGIEITETAIMKDLDRTISILLQLKQLAVHISVDDFGIGYSSLQYLKIFPLDMLKIDRAFVTDLPRSREDRAIVGTVVTLGRHLGLQILAEGVEDETQWRILQSLGVDEGQGYLFGRPCSADDFLTTFCRPGKKLYGNAARKTPRMSYLPDTYQQLSLAEGA